MKQFCLFLLLLISGAAYSQTDLNDLLETTHTPEPDRKVIRKKLSTFLLPLASSRASEVQLLRKTFRKVHATFLKQYVAYSNVDQIFSTGQYDCLTATALFSHVLDQLNYSYEIIETNYHIFLVVYTAKGKILLETTDRFGGFVMDEAVIRERMISYQYNQIPLGSPSKFYYQYSFELYRQISAEKLVGLLYYNQAVRAFNQHDWLTSSLLLEKANALYASPRCEEFGPILIQSVLGSSLTEDVKNRCLVSLRNFWTKKSEIIASN